MHLNQRVFIFSILRPSNLNCNYRHGVGERKTGESTQYHFWSLFTAIMLLIAVTASPITAEISAYVFYAMLESTITSIIIWQAWTWPKQKE
jgi:hypothetical protein